MKAQFALELGRCRCRRQLLPQKSRRCPTSRSESIAIIRDIPILPTMSPHVDDMVLQYCV